MADNHQGNPEGGLRGPCCRKWSSCPHRSCCWQIYWGSCGQGKATSSCYSPPKPLFRMNVTARFFKYMCIISSPQHVTLLPAWVYAWPHFLWVVASILIPMPRVLTPARVADHWEVRWSPCRESCSDRSACASRQVNPLNSQISATITTAVITVNQPTVSW
jgi:hypothetical protein